MANQEIALMAHLMRRAGFGATREELEETRRQGLRSHGGRAAQFRISTGAGPV